MGLFWPHHNVYNCLIFEMLGILFGNEGTKIGLFHHILELQVERWISHYDA
jgi:hypothetical protein